MDKFVEAMEGFPKMNKVIAQPDHVAVGSYITVVCDGSTLGAARDVGMEMAFLNVPQRELNPVWGDEEWIYLLDNICASMSFFIGCGDDLDCCPQDETRKLPVS